MSELRFHDPTLNADHLGAAVDGIRTNRHALDDWPFGLIVRVEGYPHVGRAARRYSWAAVNNSGGAAAGRMLAGYYESVGAAIAENKYVLGFGALLDIMEIVGIFLDFDH